MPKANLEGLDIYYERPRSRRTRAVRARIVVAVGPLETPGGPHPEPKLGNPHHGLPAAPAAAANPRTATPSASSPRTAPRCWRISASHAATWWASPWGARSSSPWPSSGLTSWPRSPWPPAAPGPGPSTATHGNCLPIHTGRSRKWDSSNTYDPTWTTTVWRSTPRSITPTAKPPRPCRIPCGRDSPRWRCFAATSSPV